MSRPTEFALEERWYIASNSIISSFDISLTQVPIPVVKGR
jgi:hypothetical protein